MPRGAHVVVLRYPLAVTFLLACTAAVSPGGVGAGGVAADSEVEEAQGPGEVDPTDRVFDPSVVHEIDLDLAPAEWADVRDNPAAENWWEASFTMDGEVVERVGIRSFGAGSQVAGKPNIKLAFDRNVDGQDFRGLEQLKLDSSTQDAGFLNEFVATSVLRSVDLPAARTTWARVRANGEEVGFFVVLEPVDDVFLRRWFGNDDGNLYGTWDWRYGQGLNVITWGGPLDWYVPQTKVETDGSDIVAAVSAVNFGSDDEFAAAVDVDQFTRVSVTRAALGAIDAFAADGNNFYLYDDGGQFKLVPWDLDADCGYPYYMSNALYMDLREPWLLSHARYNPVTGALYSDPVHARAMAMGWDVEGWMDGLWSGPLDWGTLDGMVAEAAALIAEDACDDTYHGCSAHRQRAADLRLFLHSRLSYLAGGEVVDCGPSQTPVVSGTVGYGELGLDESAWGPGLVVNGQHYCHGILAWAPSSLVAQVPGGTLAASVGLHDWNYACGDGAVFSVSQGGTALWTSDTIVQYQDALAFSVPVAAGEVRLDVAALGTADCDAAAWLDLRVQ